MISRTPTLADWSYRLVRLACDHCPRCGQYRKDTLVETVFAEFSKSMLRSMRLRWI
jgi:hypothetical protein